MGSSDPSAYPTIEDRRDDGDPTVAPHTLGRYVVIDELGEGGMGRVFLAYDPELQREVALKVVRSDALSSEAWERLILEARAMARLSHPNVVPIYDVIESTEVGVVLAMEYVKGPTLRGWFEGTHRPWTEVVDAFVAAGRGLAAAHAADLVHRDFKPSNVLCTVTDGRLTAVKVSDFGLVRPLGTPSSSFESSESTPAAVPEPVTQRGLVVGTPKFMAPEQHHGVEVGPASDQYSLCVALWEALCGEFPFEGAGLVRAKRRGPPAWPDHVHVPRPVVDAIRRGLAPRPEDRWPSLHALLRRLHGSTRGSRGPARWVLGGSVIMAGLAFLSGRQGSDSAPCTESEAQLAGVWNATTRADLQAGFAALGTSYAPAVATTVEQGLDDYAREWTALHSEVCAATAIERTQTPAELDLRMSCLQRARNGFATTVEVLSSPDAAVVERAGALLTRLPALTDCSDLESLRRAVVPPRPHQVDAVRDIRRSIDRGRVLTIAGRYERAAALLEETRGDALRLGYEPVRAECELVLGSVLSTLGKTDEAVALLRGVMRRAGTTGQWDEVQGAAAELAFTVGVNGGAPREGFAYARVAHGLAEQSTKPSVRAQVRNAFAALLHAQGRLDEAEREYRAVLALLEDAYGIDSPDALLVRNNLSGALFAKGDLAGAEQQLRSIREVVESRYGEDHPQVAMSHNNLAVILHAQRRFGAAAEEAEAALRSRERLLGPTHPETVIARGNLAQLLLEAGRPEVAEPVARRVVEELSALLGEGSVEVGHALGTLGEALLATNRPVDAARTDRDALAVFESVHGPAHLDTISARLRLADALDALGRLDDAESQRRRAIADGEPVLGPGHPRIADGRMMLGESLLRRGAPHRALVVLERAWEVRRRPDLPDAPRAEAAFALARAHFAAGHPVAAARFARLARDGFALDGDVRGDRMAEVEAFVRKHALDDAAVAVVATPPRPEVDRPRP